MIRIWEKRYSAVKPSRTTTNRRLYTEQDVERLVLLKRATLAGHSIGTVAHLPSEQLIELIERSKKTVRPVQSMSATEIASLFERCLSAVEHLDRSALKGLLAKASEALGPEAVTYQVVIPLLNEIGERWYDGRLRVSHEHMMSAVMRTFLGSMAVAFDAPTDAPLFIVCTPTGQLHEFGALMAGVMALSEEWRIINLGPNLPAEEIADTVKRTNAAAVGVSLVYPVGDVATAAELSRLRDLLGPSTPIIVGGRACESYRATIDAIRGIRAEKLEQLPRILQDLLKG